VGEEGGGLGGGGSTLDGMCVASPSAAMISRYDHWVRGQFLLFWFQFRTATVFWEGVLKVSFTPKHNFILLKRLIF
jgi:hypothetical protein